MSTQHTPGPWCWLSDNDLWSEKDGEVLGAGDDGKPYGMHSGEIHHHYDPVVKEANKRLIAAAPELLEAHEPDLLGPYFLDWVADRMVHVYGESENVDFVLALRRRAEKARNAIAKVVRE